jgi:hypothetical protein
MTYSGTLDETVPGQGEFARLGAGRIRSLTLAVKERLASIFVNPDADPLVFKIPVARMFTVEHTFPSPTSVVGGFSAHAVIPLPAGETPPLNCPIFANWKTQAGMSTLEVYVIHTWFDGTNIQVSAYNPASGTGDLAGKVLRVTVLYSAGA